ncbi:MAG: SDR family NAD(P)-dependent oxidoreductase [Chloroflexota bacterium]|nr:SDR family NAD(P)-dependent oxidoreductase [Chloroflexota bacterium]
MGVPGLSLEGKLAIVTGGRRGIGRAIALAMAEAGADVALCDRVTDDGELAAVAEEIQRFGRRALAVKADVTRKADVDNLVRVVMGEFGAIDILVNNVAMNIMAPLLELGEDGWDKVINTDLKGYYLCCQAAGRKMVDRKGGRIINIASTAAMKAAPGMGAYCIAKAGVVMLTRVLALELAQYNIRVNAIAPYMVKTKFSQPLWSDARTLKQIEAEIPLGHLAETKDVVGTVLFLASGASGYITGHTIVVDGGLSA